MQRLIEQIEMALRHADSIGATATALWLDRARWAIEEDIYQRPQPKSSDTHSPPAPPQ